MARELGNDRVVAYGVVAVAAVIMFGAGIAAHLMFPNIIVKLCAMVAAGIAVAVVAGAVSRYAHTADKAPWWPLPAAIAAKLTAITGLGDNGDPPTPPSEGADARD